MGSGLNAELRMRARMRGSRRQLEVRVADASNIDNSVLQKLVQAVAGENNWALQPGHLLIRRIADGDWTLQLSISRAVQDPWFSLRSALGQHGIHLRLISSTQESVA